MFFSTTETKRDMNPQKGVDMVYRKLNTTQDITAAKDTTPSHRTRHPVIINFVAHR